MSNTATEKNPRKRTHTHNWFDANKLTLHFDKSCILFLDVLMLVTRIHHHTRRSSSGACSVYSIPGVVIDSDLSWKEHIDYAYHKIF